MMMRQSVLRVAAILVVFLTEMTMVLLVLPRPARAKDVEEKKNDGRQMVQEMKIEAPIMTEEDQHGYNMPDRYLCDACKAVVYQLNQTMVRRQPKSRRLKEWEYTELFDEICATQFEGYGIKLVNGENVLSGPGLVEPEVKPGGAMIQMGGENWKKRMGEICRKFVSEKVGEEELYQSFYKKGELEETMCFQLTKDCSLGPKPKKGVVRKEEKKSSAPKQQGQGKKEEQKQKKEEKKPKSSSLKGSVASKAGAKKPSDDTNSDRAVDIVYFLTQMAVEEGVPPASYTRNRNKQEWERTIVSLAGKLFGKQSTSSSSSSDTGRGATTAQAEEGPAIEV